MSIGSILWEGVMPIFFSQFPLQKNGMGRAGAILGPDFEVRGGAVCVGWGGRGGVYPDFGRS